jgi:hypothetical protein
MVETRGTFAARVLPGIGLATLWALLAYIVETFVIGSLRVAGSQGGILAPLGGWDMWIRPTTVLGAALFLVVAVAFVRMCARSGLPEWLTAASMAVGVTGFWAWAALYGHGLATTHPEMGLAAAVRFAAPISVSSTAGICAGMLVAILLAHRSASMPASGV